MILSDAYKNDILSKNTQLVPLLIIEKFISEEMGAAPFGGETTYERIFLSTHNIQVGSHYFKPLLLNMPNLSQNIDLDEGKFQTSSLTLNISNTDYNNSGRLSEELSSYSLMNAIVCIHYKSQSCNKIQLPNQSANGVVNENTNIASGCPRVFTGVIRDIQHQRDELKITIEDITDKRITRELPNVKLGSTDNIPDKYKNEYIPMLYGRVENAPTVAEYDDGLFTIKADSMSINRIHEQEWGEDNYLYGGIKLYADDQYLGVTKYAHWEGLPFGEETADELFYGVYPDMSSQYITNDKNQVSFRRESMLNQANRIEVLKTGVPKNIILMQNNDLSIEFGDNLVLDPALVDFVQEYDIQHIENSDYKVATDIDLSTFFNKNLSNEYYWSNETSTPVLSNAISFHVLFSLQWDTGVSGADYVRVIDNKVNNIKIPVKGDANLPSGYGSWDNVFNEIWVIPNNLGAILLSGSNNFGMSVNPDSVFELPELNLENLISLGNSDTFTNILGSFGIASQFPMPYNEDAKIKVTNTIQLNTTAGFLWNMPNILPFIRFGAGSGAIPDASIGWSSLEVLGHVFTDGTPNNYYDVNIGGDIGFHLDIKIEEIGVTALAQFNDARENEFYLNAEGRTDEFLFNYEHFWTFNETEYAVTDIPEILENPVDTIRHILVEECGLSNDQFDEDEFNLAWVSRQQGGHALLQSPIKLGFSVNEVIDSKELLQKISQNCLVFPRFKNDGKMGFVTLQRAYYPEYDYNLAREVDINDIISYKFGLSKELISKIDVSYNHSYGQGKNLKTTDAREMTEVELNWYGISNVEDNYLNYNADYIQDEQSAIQLRNMLWYDRKAKHLEIDLTLPLSYIDLEIGDLCKFPDKLIDDIKAHGIDYTIFDNHGGVLRVPLFKVIKVNKNLDNIKVTLHQLHWLDTQSNAISDMQSGLWDSVGLDNDLIDPMLEGVEETDDFQPYEPAPFTEFLIGNDSFFTIGDSVFPSSYSREFIITDQSIGTGYNPLSELSFNLRENFDTLFGSNRFGLSNWQDLMPTINADGSGYGSISIGNNFNQVGGFIAMEIRMTNANGYSDRVLSLRNIAGTEFDSDIYDSSTTIIPDNITPSTTELKLGWVLYVCDSNWNYLNISGNDGTSVIDDNLNIEMHPVIDNSNTLLQSMTYNYNVFLYPYSLPTNDTKLTYSTIIESQLLQDELLLGDSNLDGSLNVLDVVGTVGHIMGVGVLSEAGQIAADSNEDEIIDILDVVLLINIILGNE